MTVALHVFAMVLVANLAVGLVRVLRGPRFEDRLLAVLLFGTTGVALLLTLAAVGGEPALRDIALVFVVLGLVAVIVATRRGGPAGKNGDHGLGCG